LLALSHYSHDPNASSMEPGVARRFAMTGGTIEEIVALRPDVVVADSFLQPAAMQALERMGLRLVRLGITDSVATSRAQVRELARLAGHPERGERLVAKIDRALAAARPLDAKPVSAIVWQGGGLVPGDKTLIAELLGRTGFINAAAARGLGQGAVLPLEAMLADPPRAVLAAGDPRADEDRLLGHPVLRALEPATRRVRLDRKLLWCGGPTIPRAAAALAAIRRDVR
jgi:iron complex transport system substrate-binding protein